MHDKRRNTQLGEQQYMSNINFKSIEVHVIGHEELIIGRQSALSLIEQQDKLGYILTYLRVPTGLLYSLLV